MAARPRPVKVAKDKLEKEREADCRDYAKSYGCALIKFVSPGNPGVPDRLLLSRYGGKAIFVELKRGNIEPSTLQLAWHTVLRRRGFHVWIIGTLAEFREHFHRAGLHV